MSAIDIQRAYYQTTAADYDGAHIGSHEHNLALHVMAGMIRHFDFKSVLDVGSGTGRAITMLRPIPDLHIVGIEPSPELRQRGHAKGIPADCLIDGDAEAITMPDRSFDLVCEFGVLHHVANPRRAVAEMLRVARRAIFISDSNNFGQGSPAARTLKQLIRAAGLWPVANFVKTRGKGYSISEGDGLFYSYSIFDDLPQIRAACTSVHMLNTLDAGPNLYRSAQHVAVLGII